MTYQPHDFAQEVPFLLSQDRADLLLQQVLPLALEVFAARADLAHQVGQVRQALTAARVCEDLDDLADALAVHFRSDIVQLLDQAAGL